MRKMLMRSLAALAVGGLGSFVVAAAGYAQGAPAAAKPANPLLEKVHGVRKLTEVSVLIGQTKFWEPGTIIVEQGDKVEIDLKNEVPGVENNQHGFAIPAYNIATVVTAGKPEKVAFTADKAGLFVFGCQLHPAHVGGQLLVLPKAGVTPLALP